MSYPGEDENGARSPQSAGALTQATQDGLTRSLASQEAAIQKFYEPRAKMYDQLAATIRARSAGPNLSERLAQISAALGQKTEYSGMGAMFSNLSPVLAAQQKAKREEQFANEDLATKYQVGRMAEEENSFNARLSAQQKLQALQMRYANWPGGNVQISGGIGFDKASGIPLVIPPMAAIVALQAYPTPERMADFDRTYGPGAAQRVMLYGSQPQRDEEE